MTGPVNRPSWCRIGITGVEADSDLVTALVPGELARRLDELLPGVEVVALTTGTGPLPIELDPPSRRLDAATEAGLHAVAPPELVDFGLDLLADARGTDPDSRRWRERLAVRGALGEGPVVVVEVDAGDPLTAAADVGTPLLVDAGGGDAAVLAAPPGVAAVEPDVAAGLLLDAYLHSSLVVATSRGGRRLATAVDPGRVTAAADAVADVADRAFAEVVRRDGAGVARRRLTAWARWGRAVDAAARAAEQRHRRRIVGLESGRSGA